MFRSIPKVFITRSDFPKNSVDLLKKRCEVTMWSGGQSNEPKELIVPRRVFLKEIADKDAIYCTSTEQIDDEVLDAAGPNLKVIATVSVGYDHIDLAACKKRGVRVGHTPNVLTGTVAELGIALLLATSRRLLEGNREVLNGSWKQWHPLYMVGLDLLGSTVGIVGLGRLGEAIVKRLTAFEVEKFLYCGRHHNPKDKEIGAKFVTFDELLKQSDFVIACCDLNPTTHGLFNRDAFSKMKPNCVFVNISRGSVVDHEALFEALSSGQIFAAGLDVTSPEPLPSNHPLTTLKNCVILPHIGSATTRTRNAMGMLTAENVLAGVFGHKLPAEL